VLRGLFELRPTPPQRWLFALRAAACMGAPILIGEWVIAATERLAYRMLSACWAFERLGGESGREAARSMFGDDGVARVHQTLAAFIVAIRRGSSPPPLAPIPSVIEAEIANLRQCLVREPARRDETYNDAQ
jgi:hypothetical protein